MQSKPASKWFRKFWQDSWRWYMHLSSPLRFGIPAFVLILVLNYWPCVIFGSPAMVSIESTHFTVHVAPEDKREALQLKTILEDRIAEPDVVAFTNATEKTRYDVYMYPDQAAFQMRRWGVLSMFFLQDRYVCDVRGQTLLLTSPRRPGLFLSVHEVLDQSVDLFMSALMAGQKR